MKRFHVHVAVNTIEAAVPFYSTLFGAHPTVLEKDYAKWMVDDPRINFSISARGAATGVNHLGLQLETDEEFRAMHAQLREADSAVVEELGANCCYAQSDKYWVTDPAGVPWETFHTFGSIRVFGASDPERTASTSACCAPGDGEAKVDMPVKARASGCCA